MSIGGKQLRIGIGGENFLRPWEKVTSSTVEGTRITYGGVFICFVKEGGQFRSGKKDS